MFLKTLIIILFPTCIFAQQPVRNAFGTKEPVQFGMVKALSKDELSRLAGWVQNSKCVWSGMAIEQTDCRAEATCIGDASCISGPLQGIKFLGMKCQSNKCGDNSMVQKCILDSKFDAQYVSPDKSIGTTHFVRGTSGNL